MNWNFTATLIEWFAKIGWAYDLKSAPASLVEKRIARCGDGTHYRLGAGKEVPVEESKEDEEEPYDDLEAVAFYEKMRKNNCNGSISNGDAVKQRPQAQRA